MAGLPTRVSFPTGSSEYFTVVEDDEIHDGDVAGGKKMNSRSTYLDALEASAGSPHRSPACSRQAYELDHERGKFRGAGSPKADL